MKSFCIFVNFIACIFSAASAGVTVNTENGPVWSDVVLKPRHGNEFLAFRGIRYAEAPVGALRFQPPQKPQKWSQLFNATTFGPACYQISGEEGLRRRNLSISFEVNEDCLFLNVYTPRVKPKTLYPVLVFVHGGAFQVGTGNWYLPYNLMETFPLVFVSMNYRLGVFGFLSSGDSAIPGNYGLKDQQATLQWVQKNIRNFGGDPKRVTLMGQSSGAHNVHAHTLSRASEGLFQRAIILSGSTLGMWGYYPPSSQEAQHTYDSLLKKTKCKTQSAKKSVECLQALSASDLKKAENSLKENGSIPFIFRAVVEPEGTPNAIIVKDPRLLDYPNPIMPIIVGMCSWEGIMNAMMMVRLHPHEDDYSQILTDDMPFSSHYKYWLKPEKVSGFTNLLKDYYFDNTQSIGINNILNISNLYSKLLFQMPAVDLALSYPGKAYTYVYDYLNEASPINKIKDLLNITELQNFIGADHGDDLISIFGTSSEPPSQKDQQISKTLLLYLKNFIQYGKPNNEKMTAPKWNPVYSKRVEYMYISKSKFEMRNGLAEDRNYLFYRSLPIPWHQIPLDVRHAEEVLPQEDEKNNKPIEEDYSQYNFSKPLLNMMKDLFAIYKNQYE